MLGSDNSSASSLSDLEDNTDDLNKLSLDEVYAVPGITSTSMKAENQFRAANLPSPSRRRSLSFSGFASDLPHTSSSHSMIKQPTESTETRNRSKTVHQKHDSVPTDSEAGSDSAQTNNL